MAVAYHALDQHTHLKNGGVTESTIEDGDSKTKSSKWQSWRVTITVAAVVALLVLAINTSAFVYIRSRGENEDGIVTIYQGPCDLPSKISTYGHLLINIISTLLLGASNACAQLLVAPTRADIAVAHSNNRWLDIGVPSLRNLRTIPWWRKLGWFALMTSSIPLHLMYNSVLFTNTAGHEYQAVLVTQEFLNTGEDFNRHMLELVLDHGISGARSSSGAKSSPKRNILWNLRDLAMQGNLTRLTKQECLAAYGASAEVEAKYGHLLAVAKQVTNSSDRMVLGLNSTNSVLDLWVHDASNPFDDLIWARGRSTSHPDLQFQENENKDLPLTPAYEHSEQAWSVSNDEQCLPVFRQNSQCQGGQYCSSEVEWDCLSIDIEVDYCLAELYKGKCAAKVSVPLLAVVIACNVMKALVICSMIIMEAKYFHPLVTIGDAIKSFLDRPETEAKGRGALSMMDVVGAAKHRKHLKEAEYAKISNLYGQQRSQRERIGAFSWAYVLDASHQRPGGNRKNWYHAANMGRASRWRLAMGLSTVLWVVAACLLIDIFVRHDSTLQVKNFDSSGLIFPTTSAPLTFNIILPNLPQLLVSFAYLFYNNALTSMLLAHEASQFATKRGTLRVSDPDGEQKSSYWLQLPYQYSVPLLAAMAMMHWLISRTIFFEANDLYTIDGEKSGYSSAACAFSVLPLIVAVTLGGILILVFLLLSSRTLTPGMPLIGFCSMAISAACANCDEGGEAATKALMYGVLTTDTNEPLQGKKRVGFSQYEVEPLREGIIYL